MGSSSVYCNDNKSKCNTASGVAKCDCLDGYGGKNCDSDIDECVESYPCPKVGSFCVDMDPPKKYECKCFRGFDPVYSDQNVLVSCIESNKCSNNACHEDAECVETTSRRGSKCVCKNGFIGDGKKCSPNFITPSLMPTALKTPMNNPSTTPRPTVPTTPMPTPRKFVGGSCISSNECATENSHCVSGKCICIPGYVQSRNRCVQINECRDSKLNKCDRNAVVKILLVATNALAKMDFWIYLHLVFLEASVWQELLSQ